MKIKLGLVLSISLILLSSCLPQEDELKSNGNDREEIENEDEMREIFDKREYGFIVPNLRLVTNPTQVDPKISSFFDSNRIIGQIIFFEGSDLDLLTPAKQVHQVVSFYDSDRFIPYEDQEIFILNDAQYLEYSIAVVYGDNSLVNSITYYDYSDNVLKSISYFDHDLNLTETIEYQYKISESLIEITNNDPTHYLSFWRIILEQDGSIDQLIETAPDKGNEIVGVYDFNSGNQLQTYTEMGTGLKIIYENNIIKQIYLSDSEIIEIIYNERNLNIGQRKFTSLSSNEWNQNRESEYNFDNRGNWVQRTQYEIQNNEKFPMSRISREIFY